MARLNMQAIRLKEHRQPIRYAHHFRRFRAMADMIAKVKALQG
jgi:hypothetical protein